MVGQRANVTLLDGSAVRGTLALCWNLNWIELRDVEAIDPETGNSSPVHGRVRIPVRSIVIVQVLP